MIGRYMFYDEPFILILRKGNLDMTLSVYDWTKAVNKNFLAKVNNGTLCPL